MQDSKMLDLVESKELIGAKVIAKNGEKIGNIQSIHIDPETLKVSAIKLDKGLFKADHYINKEYLQRLGEDGAVLNILPLEDLNGKKVVDRRGRMVGIIKNVELQGGNNLLTIVVERKDKDNLLISEKHISEISDRVVLKVIP